MSTATHQRPKRKLRWWLAGLILAAFGVSAWLAFNCWRPQPESSEDLELIVESALRTGHLNAKEVRAQIGDERFWRAIKGGIRGRPTEWEAGLQERLTQKGRLPAWFQAIMDTLLFPLEKRWKQRDKRLNTALSIIMWDLQKTATPVLPELISLAESRRDRYALQGIQVLRALRENAAPALPLLFRRLERTDNFASVVAEAINTIDPAGNASTLRFVALLQRADDDDRVTLLPAIGLRARHHPELATNLWPMLQHTNRQVVTGAITGLAKAGLLTAAYLEEHRAGFDSADVQTRWLSLNLVAHAGVNAGGFVPELRAIGLLKGPDQSTVLTSLTEILFNKRSPTEQRFAAAEAILASDSAHDALFALGLLDQFGAGWPQVTLTTGALVHPDVEVRAEAVRRLGEMGPAARPALPQMRALRQDKEKLVRDAVELALPKLGE